MGLIKFVKLMILGLMDEASVLAKQETKKKNSKKY